MLRIVSAWHRPPGLCCSLTISTIHEEKPHRPGGPCHTERAETRMPLGTRIVQASGVNPSVETICSWHTCRSLIFPSQTTSSPSELSSVGEAEAGSGGDQPAEE